MQVLLNITMLTLDTKFICFAQKKTYFQVFGKWDGNQHEDSTQAHCECCLTRELGCWKGTCPLEVQTEFYYFLPSDL